MSSRLVSLLYTKYYIGQSTYDLGELRSDFDANNAFFSAQFAHLENQVNSLEVAILSGTANVGSGSANIINSTSINSSNVGTDEGGPQVSLQIQLMLAKIENNEMEIEKLKAENAIIMANLTAIRTGHGIGGQIQLITLNSAKNFLDLSLLELSQKNCPCFVYQLVCGGGGGVLFMLGKLGCKTH